MLLDIIAVVIGVLYTVRKLDVRRREPEQYPNVPRAEFERWRSLEAGGYSLGSIACFAKVLLDYGFVYYAKQASLPVTVIRVVGATLFVTWVVLLVVAWFRAHNGRKLRNSLGIDLTAPPPGSAGAV